jgi:hypothetical protein
MKTVGGNPFRIARPSRAQRSGLRDWLPLACAMLGAAIFAMGTSSSAWARKSGPLATTVWVANSGAFNAGSLETFAGGTSRNTKPLYRNNGPDTLLQYFLPLGPFVATSPAGVAITPDSPGHVSVVGQTIGGVLTFSPTANGDTPPETFLIGPDTGLGTPAGDTYGLSPFYFTVTGHSQGLASSFNELYVTSIASSIDTNGAVTEYPEGANGDQIPDEAIGGSPLVTAMAEPVGIYADVTHAEICLPPEGTLVAAPPADYCDGGLIVATISTRRIWVVQRFLGLVTIYLPEVACAISPYDPTASPPVPGFCPGQSLNTALPSYVAQQPPVGGAFFTTEDLLPPPSAGGTSTDPTNPNYIAVQPYPGPCALDSGFACPEVYVTDLAGGHRGHGRIKFFSTILNDACLVPDTTGTYCLEALRGGLLGIPDGTIEGKMTLLRKPMGIAVQATSSPSSSNQSTSDVNNLFVTNVDANNIVQFSDTERGNVSPDAYIRGGKTKLHQPVGIAVPPPSMLISTNQHP